MFNAFPLKMRVLAEDAPSQLEFALKAAARLPLSERYRLEAGRTGLVMFAASECELEDLARLLRELYAGIHALACGAPLVCLQRHGGRVYQPIMHVRIRARRAALHLILLDLMDRQAQVLEVDYIGNDAVVRARAPLPMLLGHAANLRLLTRGLFELCSQAVGYEALPRDAAEPPPPPAPCARGPAETRRKERAGAPGRMRE